MSLSHRIPGLSGFAGAAQGDDDRARRAVVLHVPEAFIGSANNQRSRSQKRADLRNGLRLGWAVFDANDRPPSLPVRVTIVRWGPDPIDADNLRGSQKRVRDEVARYLRLPLGTGGLPDDSDPRVCWRVLGALGPSGLTICIEPWAEGPADDGLDRLEVVAERKPGALALAYPEIFRAIAASQTAEPHRQGK